MQKLKLLFLAAFSMFSMKTFAQQSCYNVVGYYPSWVAGGNYYINSPSKIDYSKYTHICYAFSIPDGNGNMSSVDNASALRDLVSRGHAANVKVLLSVGGWLTSSPSNTPFEAISTNTTAINNFVNACANMVTTYNLDGIDLDWEYPTSKTRWNAVAVPLGNRLHSMGKLFTAAVSESGNNNGNNYDNVTMLDLVNIMCYGNDALASSAMSYWTSRGVPQNKRMLGVPFYSSDNNSAEHVRKANMAKTTGGGIMIWDIASEYGDINAIYNTLGTICKGDVNPVPTNLASNKRVVVSSTEASTTTSTVGANATDGNYGTRWSSAFSDPQWLYVDLGATYNVNRVKITWEAAYASAYDIQISADSINWSPLRSISGNTTLVNDVTGLAGTGRYVRINGTARATAYGYSIYELEVYGNAVVSQTPYGGSNWAIPGKIEAENYDNGGEGVAYHDLTPANQGGQYRTAEAVDVETCNEGGYNLSYVQNGEWFEYTVNVNTAGVYTLQARVATNAAGKSFHVELDGQNISGPIAIPNTGDWQTWATVNVTTPALTTGTKVLRLVVDAAEFNINWLNFTLQSDNIAANKTVSASSVEPETDFSAIKAFDGDATTTRWSSTYTDSEWIAVDLGTTQSVSKVVLKWENAFASAYRIETSLDNSNWSVQKEVTDGAIGTATISFPAVNARYVRMHGVQRGTPYGYSIWEFEVYPAPAAARQTIAAINPEKAVTAKPALFAVNTWPNPASNVLTVQTKGAAPLAVLKAYSIDGRVVYQSKVNGANQIQVNVSGWPKGIYVIEVGDSRKKVVVE